MNNEAHQTHCRYCTYPIVEEDRNGWIYAIEEDETITKAHKECMEVYDDLKIEVIEW